MINITKSYQLNNKLNNELAFKICSLKCDIDKNNTNRIHLKNEHFTIFFVKNGKGTFQVDLIKYKFSGNNLFFLSPGQSYIIDSDNIDAFRISFSRDFYCIETHKKEVSCNGVLFNNLYQRAFIKLNQNEAAPFNELTDKIVNEVENPSIAQEDLLVSYLKIFLISATRLKLTEKDDKKSVVINNDPEILNELKELIEAHFKEKHTPAEYAGMLFVTPKALGKQVKKYTGKTVSDLIKERIILEAKRELHYGSKTIKEIAFDLGFEDPAYFSRYFKKASDQSPEDFRQYWGNLSKA